MGQCNRVNDDSMNLYQCNNDGNAIGERPCATDSANSDESSTFNEVDHAVCISLQVGLYSNGNSSVMYSDNVSDCGLPHTLMYMCLPCIDMYIPVSVWHEMESPCIDYALTMPSLCLA